MGRERTGRDGTGRDHCTDEIENRWEILHRGNTPSYTMNTLSAHGNLQYNRIQYNMKFIQLYIMSLSESVYTPPVSSTTPLAVVTQPARSRIANILFVKVLVARLASISGLTYPAE